MKKSVFNILAATFAIIGGVVGTGFITGGEAAVFFLKDPSASGVYASAICFFLMLFVSPALLRGKACDLLGSLVNLVVSSCALSVVGELVYTLLGAIAANVFVIAFAVLSMTVAKGGVRAVGKTACVLTLTALCFAVGLCIIEVDGTVIAISPRTLRGVFYPVLYSGVQITVVSPIATRALGSLSIKERALSSFATTAVIFSCVFLFVLKFGGVAVSSTPLIDSVSSRGFKVVFCVVCLIVAFSSSCAASFSLYETSSRRLPIKIVKFLTVIALARAGFSKILSIAYPIVGALGYGVAFIGFLRVFFPVLRRERTFRRRERIKSPCSPLRDLV